MNILYHHRTRGEGVEGVHIRGMVKGLSSLGHRVWVLSPPGVPLEELTLKGAKGVSLRRYYLRRFWWYVCFRLPGVFFEILELFYNLFEISRMLRVIRRNDIDFIYERYSLNSFAGVLAAKRFGIPIILEINDASFVERVRRLKIRPLARFMERWIFKRADALVAVSNRFKEIIVENSGISPQKVHVISNGCDVGVFDPQRYKEESIRRRYNIQGKLVVGYVGGFVYWHGLELLVEMMSELQEADERLHFLLVGGGRDFKKITREITRRGLEDRVTFAGNVPHKEIPSHLSVMDIGVIPSSYDYASPMKLFEYMAMGVVPVAPRLGPIAEIIEDGVNGLLFEPGEVNGMREKMLELARDGKKRSAIGSNARKTILRQHRWEDKARQTLSIYEGIKRE